MHCSATHQVDMGDGNDHYAHCGLLKNDAGDAHDGETPSFAGPQHYDSLLGVKWNGPMDQLG